MNDPLERLDVIAAAARQESPPRTRVTAAVLAELREQAEAEERPMLIFAAGSVALAMGCAAFGVYMLDAITDPLALLFHTTPVLG
jgi:hypothetical protein